MSSDFSECLVLNTVMAARAMTRRYDKELKAFGVSVIQFSVLMTVRDHGAESVNRMAGRIAMDRTTLLRNLDVLERQQLVVSRKAAKGNIRHLSLTSEGETLLAKLIPRWHRAQREVRELLSGCDPTDFLGALRLLKDGEAAHAANGTAADRRVQVP